jgi:hydrogenase maturation protease
LHPEELYQAILIVGIGNIDRGDDGAGIAAARRIRAKRPPHIPIIEQSGEGTDLISLWQTTNASIVYLIDAMSSGLPPGTIQQFEAHFTPLPAKFARNHSTHSFGLVHTIELARALACLPNQVFVYGIEGKCFDVGATLSVEVETAARQVAERIAARLG